MHGLVLDHHLLVGERGPRQIAALLELLGVLEGEPRESARRAQVRAGHAPADGEHEGRQDGPVPALGEPAQPLLGEERVRAVAMVDHAVRAQRQHGDVEQGEEERGDLRAVRARVPVAIQHRADAVEGVEARRAPRQRPRTVEAPIERGAQRRVGHPALARLQQRVPRGEVTRAVMPARQRERHERVRLPARRLELRQRGARGGGAERLDEEGPGRRSVTRRLVCRAELRGQVRDVVAEVLLRDRALRGQHVGGLPEVGEQVLLELLPQRGEPLRLRRPVGARRIGPQIRPVELPPDGVERVHHLVQGVHWQSSRRPA